jgi:hypothetical protein
MLTGLGQPLINPKAQEEKDDLKTLLIPNTQSFKNVWCKLLAI